MPFIAHFFNLYVCFYGSNISFFQSVNSRMLLIRYFCSIKNEIIE